MHTSFARTLQLFTCSYLGFVATYTHKRAHTHTCESSSSVLLSVLKFRFVGEINSALLRALICIMLVFHKIVKARFAGLKVPRYRTS